MLKLPPLTLYIHYPFCVKKCPYCDFNSHLKDDNSRDFDYVGALLSDLDADLKYLQGRKICAIFIGGGTPSLLSENEMQELFFGLKKRLEFEDNIEVTMEANPGSFEVQKFAAFREIGVNRLSLGVQSFADKNLKSLGRVHNSADALNAINEAQKVGFKRLNIDIMYGLENQSLADCMADLKLAIAQNPEHISFYQLTIEPNTFFAKFPPKLPENQDLWKMGEVGKTLLEQHNFAQYEVSAFGKKPSAHNLNYWQFGDYIGIGAGACGKITDLKKRQIVRSLKPKSPQDFMLQKPTKTTIVAKPEFEFMLNALRLKSGFDRNLFEIRTGSKITSIQDKLDQAESSGLLHIKGDTIKPSKKGFDFLNDLQEIFL